LKTNIVVVEWIDAVRDDDVVVAGAGPIGCNRQTVGWLLRNDEHGVVMAMSDDEGSYERGFFIPFPYIVQVTQLVPYWTENNEYEG